MIIHGDCLDKLKELEDESIDMVCTDPPYGYSFMGKDWDKAVPSVKIWKECLRVLKPGAFCMVMSAPRSDVQNAMISRLMQAGFRLDFTPIYWTYASGFPKAGNIGKLVDKRLGAEREVIGKYKRPDGTDRQYENWSGKQEADLFDTANKILTEPATSEAKALDGSYTGFQPKPAVEVVIVAMKSLSEKTYVDQALKNGKGITWLDDCRIPTSESTMRPCGKALIDTFKGQEGKISGSHAGQGRFPANLLVSDDVLNDTSDTGSYSRYFDLDKWYERNNNAQEFNNLSNKMAEVDTQDNNSSLPQNVERILPFIITPKASKSEKNRGLEHLPVRQSKGGGGLGKDNPELARVATAYGSIKAEGNNHHPTVKPLKLMSYLITLGSRPTDTILDPFCGSGTTCLAAKNLGRNYIGIEREAEYIEIAQARLDKTELIQANLLEGV